MFDFFKDVYSEINGVDIKKAKEEKKEKDNENIIDKKSKYIIYTVGFLYILVSIISICETFKNGFNFIILKYVSLMIMDVAALILISINNKKLNIIAIIIIALFIIINFLTSFLK